MSSQTITVIKGDGIRSKHSRSRYPGSGIKVGCNFNDEYVVAGLTALETDSVKCCHRLLWTLLPAIKSP